MSQSLSQQLAEGLSQLKLVIDESQQQKLLDYIALLSKWNKVYSLTAIREPQRMVAHHLLDSLAPLLYLGEQAQRVLDVGSGFGTPGIPMAIARPDWQFCLLDSNSKKTTFVRQAVLELQLKNVIVVSERVEHYQPENAFQIVTSRAFSDLAEFVRLTRHLLAENGHWAALKGVYPFEEIAQLPSDITVRSVEKLLVPGVEAERHLVNLVQS